MSAIKLLIVSHVIHFEHAGAHYAYSPYVREIDLWADLFPEVRIACPIRHEPPPSDCVAFSRPDIGFYRVTEAGGETVVSKLKLLVSTPLMTLELARAMRWPDAIHVRCPGNLGLLGALLAPLFSRRLVAKYAGSWATTPDDEFTTYLQRWLLRHWFSGPVTVYGEWPGEPSNIVPFMTSSTTEEQMERARRAAANRKPPGVIRVLYTGRLSKSKNVDITIRAIADAAAQGVQARFTVVGDGPERANLETLAGKLGLASSVTFAGNLPFDKVLEHLEQSDVFVMASGSEGWPKSIAEAMAFGLVCVGSNQGFQAQMLRDRGAVVPPGDPEAIAAVLVDIARNRERYGEIGSRAAAWAQRFTLEGLRRSIQELVESRWSVRLPVRDTQKL